MEELDDYPTFNALARSAMILGIPIIPFILISVTTVILGMIGLMIVGLQGMLILVISIPLLLMLRTISATDDRAVNILGYELLCVLKRKNAKAFGDTNTILATKYGRNRHDYQRFTRQNLK